MKKYCEACNKEVKTKVVKKKETYEVLGEQITVEANVLTCANCGEELFCEELDNETLNKAFDIYRRNHKLLTVKQIIAIRKQYDLSQRAFARVLNWSDKTIRRYEEGAIQDKSHNSLLVFLKDPKNMLSYLEENEVPLTDKQRKKLLDKVNGLINENKTNNHELLDIYFSSEPDEFNGFKSFDYEKVCSMVAYFAKQNKELLETKLMKLLHYTDMLYFKEYGTSMSGLKYAHLPFGPVPNQYNLLFATMELDGIAHINITNSGYEKHEVIVDSKDLSPLTKQEMAVLKRIDKKFKEYGSKKISEYSHKGKGYNNTSTGELISYEYAKDMNFDESCQK